LEKLTELLENLLLWVIGYPMTLFWLLFFPKKVFSQNKSPRICPPGIAFFFTIFITYVGVNRYFPDLMVTDQKWATLDILLVIGLAGVAVIVNIQHAVISLFKPATTAPIKDQLKILLYPMALNNIIALPCIPFLIAEAEATSSTWPFLLAAMILNIWSLTNICRVFYSMATGKALMSALAAHFASSLVVGIFAASGVTLFRHVS